MNVMFVSNVNVTLEISTRTPVSLNLNIYNSFANWYWGRASLDQSTDYATAPQKIPAYKFKGWYTYPTDSASARDDIMSRVTEQIGSSNVISYSTINSHAKKTYNLECLVAAIYEPADILVTLDTNGGTLDGNYFVRVYIGQPYGTLPTPVRTGYTFAGWYTAKTRGSRVTQNTTVTNRNDHTLYAHWTAIPTPHTLYFDANGGTVSPSSKQVNSGSSYGSLPTPTWNYHTSVGWFTAPYGGTQVSSSTIMGDDDTTVYAHWTQDTATVTFNGNGGTPDVPSASYSAGSAYGSLPSATRQYYVLIGWFTAATGGTQITPGDTATTQILYAHWQEQGDSVDGVIWNSNNTDCILENS